MRLYPDLNPSVKLPLADGLTVSRSPDLKAAARILRCLVVVQALCFLLFSFGLLFFAAQARAAEPPPPQWFLTLLPELGGFSTPEAACDHFKSIQPGSSLLGNQYVELTETTGFCAVWQLADPHNTSFSTPIGTQAPCPESLTIPSTIGLYQFGTSSPAGKTWDTLTAIQSKSCIGGYVAFFGGNVSEVSPDGMVTYYRTLDAGIAKYYVRSAYRYDCSVSNYLVPCDGEKAPAEKLDTPPADTCPSGQTLGTINGEAYCFSAEGDVQNPNASEAAPTSVVTPDPVTGGSTTVTTWPDGSTQTVIKDASGNVTGGSATPGVGTGPGSGFCQQNPSHTACGAFTGGDCAAGFTCSGDAVQCAIMREQHIRNCRLFDDRNNPATALGDQLLAGNTAVDGDPRLEENRETHNLASRFNVTPTIGASCVEDDVFYLAGQPIRLAWSSLCPYMQVGGQIFVVLSMIAGLGIMFGYRSPT